MQFVIFDLSPLQEKEERVSMKAASLLSVVVIKQQWTQKTPEALSLALR